MATQLVDSMATEWNPDAYRNEFRERLSEIIRKRIKDKGATTRVLEEPSPSEDATTNVVDFVALLQKSLGEKTRTPAKKAEKKTPAKKKPAKKAAKSGAARKTG